MKRFWFGLFYLCLLVACGGDKTPEPSLSVALSADIENGSAPLLVNFDAAVPNADNSLGYSWNFGTGQSELGSASRAFTFTEAGRYEVTVEVTRDGESAKASKTIEVSAAPTQPGNRPPVVELSATTTSGTAPLPVEFSAKAVDPDGDELAYSWNFGDSATVAASGVATQSHIFEEAGSYEATVTVTDNKGGVDQATLQVAVADPNSGTGEPPVVPVDPTDNEPPTVTLTASTVRGPAPLTVSFGAEASDPDGNPLEYSWSFGNGQSADGNISQTVTYDAPGSYTTSVKVSDGLASEQASVKVQVDTPSTTPPNNQPPSVTIRAAPTRGKAPLPVSFSASVSDPDSDRLSYVWDFGDGTISGEKDPKHTYREGGSYTASLTVGDHEGGKTRKEVKLEVAPPTGEPGDPDVPFYGEWAWAAESDSGKTFEGYLSIAEKNPEPLPPNVLEGGLGPWTHCKGGIEGCGNAPMSGVGHVDIVEYGQGKQFDIVFVDSARNGTTLVAFDDDDTLGSEIDGAPSLIGGGAWFNPNGSSENLNFAMVKIGGAPVKQLNETLRLLSERVNHSSN